MTEPNDYALPVSEGVAEVHTCAPAATQMRNGWKTALRARVAPWSWVAWMALAALCIHWQETIYRLSTGLYKIPGLDLHLFPQIDTYFSFSAHAWLQPSYIIAGLGIFYGFRQAPTFLAGWATFIFCIVASRVVITTVHTGEAWNGDVMLGLVLLVYGLYLTTKMWRYPYGEPAAHPDGMPPKTYGWQRLGIGAAVLLALAAAATISRYGEATGMLVQDLRLDWWMLWLFIAAACIAFEEYWCREASFPRFLPIWLERSSGRLRIRYMRKWNDALWFPMIPFSLALNAGLFYGYRDAYPSFMFAWAVYTIYDVVLRIINNRVLGEPFYLVHALGMLLVIIGTWLTYLGGMPG